MPTTRVFTMPFEPTTVDHLGVQLYGTLPPVISELVSNAYDAESQRVEISLPVGPIDDNSEVVIRDFGHGLTSEEIQGQFLPIGRPRRGEDGKNNMSRNGKVRVTGRKGLGKLAAFGVATEVDVRFIRDGQATCLRLNYDDLHAWPLKHKNKDYQPEFIPSRSGPTKEKSGGEIRLRRLHRVRAISLDEVRRGLARRLNFIGKKFVVTVNGTGIKPGDRVRKTDCANGFCWEVKDTPGNGKLATGDTVTGWIGFLEKSSQTERGIDIFANGKAAELGSFFNLSSTHAQFARAHLIGEINADALDESEDDISTARNTVVWESDTGHALQEWGQGLLKWAFDRWVEMRREDKEQLIFTEEGFDDWLKTRLPTEKKIARRMVKELIQDEMIEPESAAPLLEIIKSSVETLAFRELVETIEEEGANAATLLRLFKEWRIIEAREHLKRADGRLSAIKQLKGFLDKGALEVQQMQPLFEQNPWLIDPSWSEADGQTTYTKLLRENFPEPKVVEQERRLDILGIRNGGGVTIVEIKRPQTALAKKHLDQIESYTDWARARIQGSGPDSPKYINGLLIIGHRTSNQEVAEKERRLSGDDIRVQAFSDLYERAKSYYGFVEQQLEKVAPEYSRKTRKGGKKK